MTNQEADILFRALSETREFHFALRLWLARSPGKQPADFLREIADALDPVALGASSA